MPAPEEYLLRFDLSKLQQELGSAEESYTNFGSSLRELIGATSADLSKTAERAAAVSGSLANMTPSMQRSFDTMGSGMGASAGVLADMSQHSEKIANDMTRIGLQSSKGSAGAPESRKLIEKQAKIEAVKGSAESAELSADEAKNAAGITIKDIRNSEKRLEKVHAASLSYLQAELKAAKAQVKSVASHVPGGVLTSGGLFGGLIAAMVLGYKEKDRLRAQSGEILNVLEATGDSLSSRASKKATRFFSGFMEKAQWFYGIAKEETKGVLKSMVDAGYKSKDVMASFRSDIGRVGKNVTIASIAVDKHFNQQTGTSMKNIIKATTELGGTLEETATKYMKLAFAGQRSGMGVENFTNAVISGASAMQQYGVDLDSVGAVMGTVKKHYQDMGLDPRYAGDQASKFVGGLSQGLASMGPGQRAVLAKRMFPELSDLDALQKFQEGFKRVSEGEGDDFLQEILTNLHEIASAGGRGRTQSIRVLEHAFNLDNQTAAGLVDMGKKVAEHNSIKVLTKKELAKVRDALKTESQRVSGLHKTSRRLTDAISSIGKGLLKVLTGLIGVIALGFKSVAAILGAWASGDSGRITKEMEVISGHFDKLTAHMGAGLDDIKSGAGKLPAAFGSEFGKDFQPLMDALNYTTEVKGGGMGALSNTKELKAAMSEMKGIFDDLGQDEGFRKQVKDQMMVDYLKRLAWLAEVNQSYHADDPHSEEYAKATQNVRILKRRAAMLEKYVHELSKTRADMAASRLLHSRKSKEASVSSTHKVNAKAVAAAQQLNAASHNPALNP